MRETLKTFLLLILVGTSIFLTKKLWIEVPNRLLDTFSVKEDREVTYELSDMIAPSKYLLNFGNKNHMLFYDDSKYRLWTNMKEELRELLQSKDLNYLKLLNEEYGDYKEKRSIVFNFPEKVNTYILAKALDIEAPNDIVELMPSIDSIYCYLGGQEAFFVFSYKDNHLKLSGKNLTSNDLKDQVMTIEREQKYNYHYSMKDTIGTSKDIYVPYEMNKNLPKVYVENEIRVLDDEKKREMAERFFNKDIDYIREIEESNGSIIYLSDQRVLKININGTLEYFNTLDGPVNKRNLYESMLAASEFIGKNTGLPKGLYLSKVEEIEREGSLGYKLNFKYRIRGIPVILGNKEVVDFVEIEVFNNHIRSYKHFIRKDMNNELGLFPEDKKMLTSFEVIDMNYDFIIKRFIEDNKLTEEEAGETGIKEILSSIEDINLAYFDPCLKDSKEQLIGVWLIKTSKGSYAFDIYTGALVYEY